MNQITNPAIGFQVYTFKSFCKKFEPKSNKGCQNSEARLRLCDLPSLDPSLCYPLGFKVSTTYKDFSYDTHGCILI